MRRNIARRRGGGDHSGDLSYKGLAARPAGFVERNEALLCLNDVRHASTITTATEVSRGQMGVFQQQASFKCLRRGREAARMSRNSESKMQGEFWEMEVEEEKEQRTGFDVVSDGGNEVFAYQKGAIIAGYYRATRMAGEGGPCLDVPSDFPRFCYLSSRSPHATKMLSRPRAQERRDGGGILNVFERQCVFIVQVCHDHGKWKLRHAQRTNSVWSHTLCRLAAAAPKLINPRLKLPRICISTSEKNKCVNI